MDLFEQSIDKSKNYLPKDGIVNYYGKIFSSSIADFYLNYLISSIDWKNDEAIIFGKKIVTKRKVAWYADQPFKYTYSNTTKKALPWTPELLQLKKIIEEETNENFNSCLLNLYHDGNEGMAWHSDGETDLKKNGVIASLSFGAERKFSFKHKLTKENIDMLLVHGSLLLMKTTTQKFWLHRLPVMKRIDNPRINLTFRTIVQ